MKNSFLLALLGALVLAVTGLAPVETVRAEEGTAEFTTTRALELVAARAFAIEEPYTFHYVAEKPEIRKGTVVVLRVPKELAYPRQTTMPVLYAGSRPIEITNVGYRSGHVVGIVPGKVDLARTPFYYGAPDLPERLDADARRAARVAARDAGIEPFAKDAVTAAVRRGGEPISVRAMGDVYATIVADWIERHSPQEKELATGYRPWATTGR